jgi:hypothetical protein
MKSIISKKVEPTGDLCIKFTDEELSSLNIKEGDKFSVSLEEDGQGILLQKYSTLELDLSEFERETLEFLIEESIIQDVSINQVIENILEKICEEENQKKLNPQ